MAKTEKPAEKPAKTFEKVLHSTEKERYEAGITLSARELEYIVKLVKACL